MITLTTGKPGEGMFFNLRSCPFMVLAALITGLAGRDPACGEGSGEARREAHPVGNTGYTSKQRAIGQAVDTFFFSGVHHG